MKKKKKKKKSVLGRTVTVIGVLVIGAVFMIRHAKTPDIVRFSDQELQARYDYNLQHAAKTNVHPLLRAVHFSIGKNFAASGTLVMRSDGTPFQIITANHLFSETQPGDDYYDYHVLGPIGFTAHGHINKVVLDSMRKSDSREGIEDVAFCYAGDPSLISRTSKVIVSAASPTGHEFTVGKTDPIRVTSITTGEQFDIVGLMLNSEKNFFYVMLYESVSGESGSGFWGSEGKLYILSGNIAISEQTRRDLEIPASYKQLTVMSAVAVKW